MSRKVAVIGMGHVGSTVAHYIVANGFADDLVLIDSNEDKVNADALDLKDAMPNLPYHTNIVVNDYLALKDAEVVVSAVGNIKLQDLYFFCIFCFQKVHGILEESCFHCHNFFEAVNISHLEVQTGVFI